MRTIFCYLAFRGCPNWWGYFNVIDISKSNYFLKMIAEQRFDKAEEFIYARKYVHDYVARDAIPLNRTNTYSGYDSPEYMSCVSYSHMLYLQEHYRDNGMLCFAEDLEAKQTGMKNVHLLPEKLNSLVIAWNRHFFGGTFGSGSTNLIKLEPERPEVLSLSQEIKDNLCSMSDWGIQYSSDVLMNAAIWDSKFRKTENDVNAFKVVVNNYFESVQKIYQRFETMPLANFARYLGLGLAYYKHLKRVKHANILAL